MLNVVVLMGRLVADPQLRQTTTGKNVASFRVACDRGRRDANGEIVASNINFVTPKSQNPAAGMGAPMASAPIPAAPADYSRPAAQPAAPAYSAGSNDDFALIEDEGDLPF